MRRADGTRIQVDKPKREYRAPLLPCQLTDLGQPRQWRLTLFENMPPKELVEAIRPAFTAAHQRELGASDRTAAAAIPVRHRIIQLQPHSGSRGFLP